MPQTDYAIDPTKLPVDPRKTMCHCGANVILPSPPMVHCYKCHHTYNERGPSPSARCPYCHFNLASWRRRNRFPERVVLFP